MLTLSILSSIRKLLKVNFVKYVKTFTTTFYSFCLRCRLFILYFLVTFGLFQKTPMTENFIIKFNLACLLIYYFSFIMLKMISFLFSVSFQAIGFVCHADMSAVVFVCLLFCLPVCSFPQFSITSLIWAVCPYFSWFPLYPDNTFQCHRIVFCGSHSSMKTVSPAM